MLWACAGQGLRGEPDDASDPRGTDPARDAVPDVSDLSDLGTAPDDARPVPETPAADPEPVSEDLAALDDGVAETLVDAGREDPGPPDCGPPETFDWTCNPDEPSSCPGGLCVYGMCLAPVMDPDRWGNCGDGVCGPCETDCRADCGPHPTFSGAKEYDNANTITVWVHGFTVQSVDDMKHGTYAKDRSCSGGVFDAFRAFRIDRPCGDTPAGEVSPVRFAKIEYFGEIPPAWMPAADAAEVASYPWDGPTALHRYALILAKFLRHKMSVSGATHVNLACHSFGCLIIRYLIEHDIEGLASGNHLVRWVTSAGVIAGARLARWSTNPNVVSVADLIGIRMYDFVVMNPDFVMDEVAAWDHRNYEGNSPFFAGMLIHQVAGTDPEVKPALNLKLLDLLNPDQEPNDGIMFSLDEYFHDQRPPGVLVLPDGLPLPATHTYVHAYHEDVAETEAMGVLATAGLFHRRKVVIRLAEMQLKKDRESHGLFDSEHGEPPAEVALDVEVRYVSQVKEVLGHAVLVHESHLDHRTPEVFRQEQQTTLAPNAMVFEGPVLDGMDAVRLDLEVLEVDWYPRFDIQEWVFDPDQALASFHGDVPLADGTIAFETEYARCVLEIRVMDLYASAPR